MSTLISCIYTLFYQTYTIFHYKNLEYVRKIRNKFAHRIFDASFEDAQIIEWCKKIKIPRIPGDDPNNYRHLFYDVAYFLAGYLHSRALSIEKQKYMKRIATP
jgi:hypothetical protein